MNVLLLHPDKENLKMISFCIESQLGIQVLPASDVQQAIELFLNDSSISLVIASLEPKSEIFFKFFLSVSAKAPIVLINNPDHANYLVLPGMQVIGQLNVSDVPDKLKTLIQKSSESIASTSLNEEYCRINTELLLRVAPLKGDVFIRLSNTKFVKVFHAGDAFTAENLDRFLVKRQVEFLYIRKEDSSEFVQKFKSDLGSRLNNVKSDDPEIINTVSEVHNLVQELTRQLGFTKEVQEIARDNIRLALTGMGTKPKIAKALAASKMASKNYISSHSVLLANISCSIAAQMDWPSNTTFQKLVLSAFFHDFVFQDVSLAKLRTKSDLDPGISSINTEQIDIVLTHPQKCADIIRSMNEIPSDVDIVVLQHHERPDGTGFPRGLHSHQISPLASVFIVAHDILDQILMLGEKFNLQEFLRRTEKEYDGHSFRKVWKALSQTSD